ncbi:hypothetical protein Ocin01_04791 [Orchesella cincta]|uniref:Uncharacterized protein n=1 Tax=Orchesella cincta TaxID=48709 RepID=A0A1D2N9H8_ORCCI|nr:hypothetical protein Ocin01_04791 [Orchesella cincta]
MGELESTNGLTSSNSSDDTSILVNIKLQESTDSSTPSRSEQSSVSTDYYNPPEGPFTSTPDGKLHPKRSSRSSTGKSFDLVKKRTLYHYVDKFLAKKPESIENLQVSTSSSSLIRADSNVLSSDSFDATFSPANHSRSGSSSSSSKSSTSSPASNQFGSSFQVMPLAPVSEEDSEFDSGSTIAETAIKAGVGSTITSESYSSSNDKSGSRSETKDTNSTSDSLTNMLAALSNQQAIEKRQLELLESEEEEEEETNSHDQASATLPNQIHGPDDPRNSSRRSSRSSSGSFPDASLVLRELRSRHKRKSPTSQSSEGSPKSGPEREAERVELLEDITPVKLWETPPKYTVRSETEQLSEVFDKLIDKWANIRIEPPPWYADLS